MTIKLNINQRDFEVDVPAEMPLLWVIRDVVGLTGTKYGCGIQQCGACTVHIDGVATRSCGVPVGDVDERCHHNRRPRRQWRSPYPEGLGANRTSRNAAIARAARSCGRRAAQREPRNRPTPISKRQCPATSAAAAPTRAFARRSTRRRRQSDVTHRKSQPPRLPADLALPPARFVLAHEDRCRRQGLGARRRAPLAPMSS